jgi:hypothetical protein
VTCQVYERQSGKGFGCHGFSTGYNYILANLKVLQSLPEFNSDKSLFSHKDSEARKE